MGVRWYHLLVCAGLNESAAMRRVFFTCGGGALTSCDRRRQRTENILKQVSGQCRMKVDDRKKSSLFWLCFFAVGTISGKSLKLLPAGVMFYSYNAPYSISAAGGAYSAPPDPSAAFKGPTSRGKERGMRRGST